MLDYGGVSDLTLARVGKKRVCQLMIDLDAAKVEVCLDAFFRIHLESGIS